MAIEALKFKRAEAIDNNNVLVGTAGCQETPPLRNSPKRASKFIGGLRRDGYGLCGFSAVLKMLSSPVTSSKAPGYRSYPHL